MVEINWKELLKGDYSQYIIRGYNDVEIWKDNRPDDEEKYRLNFKGVFFKHFDTLEEAKEEAEFLMYLEIN